MGCVGCGCAVLLVLLVLFVGLVAGLTYLVYTEIYSLTSPTASAVQTFDGGDDLYKTADDKVTAFDQALQQHQPASLHLSADEMNTLLARDPHLSELKIRLFITVTGDQAHAQISYPTNFLPLGLIKDRYFNGDCSLGLNFDPGAKTVHLFLHSLHIGSQSVPEDDLPLVQTEIDPILNAEFQKIPELQKIVAQARTITIRDGEFVIETQ